jgi:hypothetical protein
MSLPQTNTYAKIFSGPHLYSAILSHMSTPDPGEVDIPPPLSRRAKAIANALLKPGDAKYIMTDLVGSDAVNHLPNVSDSARVVLKPFQRAARWFPFGIYPFARVGDVLLAGAKNKVYSQENIQVEDAVPP